MRLRVVGLAALLLIGLHAQAHAAIVTVSGDNSTLGGVDTGKGAEILASAPLSLLDSDAFNDHQQVFALIVFQEPRSRPKEG